jgi:hypothetical protein
MNSDYDVIVIVARPPAGAARPLRLRDLGARLRSSPTVATALEEEQ